MGVSGSPWLYLSEHWPHVDVFYRAFTDDQWGRTVWTEAGPIIYLRALLGPIAERCTLWHEIGHLELGPPDEPECPINEAAVVVWTARTLLPDVRQIARVLARHDVITAARILRVTRRVLQDRLRELNDSERDVFNIVIARAEITG